MMPSPHIRNTTTGVWMVSEEKAATSPSHALLMSGSRPQRKPSSAVGGRPPGAVAHWGLLCTENGQGGAVSGRSHKPWVSPGLAPELASRETPVPWVVLLRSRSACEP